MKKELINKDIKFIEDSHQYFYKNKELISVTTILKEYFPFDSEKIINILIKNPKLKNFYGKTIAEVKQMWMGKAQIGTDLHLYCENYINGKKDVPKTKLAETAERYLKTLEYDKCYPELLVISENLGIAGTIDLLVKKDDKWYIYDWKTDKAIVKKNREGDKCKKPIENIDICNYNKHTFQLNIYALLLEREYGIKIENVKIVHIRENKGKKRINCTVLELPNRRDEAKTLLGHWVSSNVTTK